MHIASASPAKYPLTRMEDFVKKSSKACAKWRVVLGSSILGLASGSAYSQAMPCNPPPGGDHFEMASNNPCMDMEPFYVQGRQKFSCRITAERGKFRTTYQWKQQGEGYSTTLPRHGYEYTFNERFNALVPGDTTIYDSIRIIRDGSAPGTTAPVAFAIVCPPPGPGVTCTSTGKGDDFYQTTYMRIPADPLQTATLNIKNECRGRQKFDEDGERFDRNGRNKYDD
jgi:hypothetical protein